MMIVYIIFNEISLLKHNESTTTMEPQYNSYHIVMNVTKL